MQQLNIFKLPKNFRGKNAIVVQSWWFIQFIFFKNSPQFLYGFRRFLLRLFGAKIGKNCTIYPGVTIGGKIGNGCPTIGDNCFIGLGAKIIGKVNIGDNVIIAPNAVVVKNVASNSVVGGVPAKNIK